MNFPRSTIKKSLHIIPDSLKDGITGDAQVTIGYQIYNLAKLTHTTAGIANLQFGDYNVNKVGLYGKNIEIHADTGRLNEYATDDIFIGSAGSMLRIGMYSSTTFDNGVNFMLMTPDVTKFQDKQVIIAANNNYENANKVSINNVTTKYGGCLLVGDYNKAHIALDNFQIQAKEDGVNAADKLCLNPMGGSVYINYCQSYFTTITLNRIQGYNINHTVGKLYLNPAGGNVVLNSDKSRLIFSTVNAGESVKASIYFATTGNGGLPAGFNLANGNSLTSNNNFCIETTKLLIEADSTYIKNNTHIEETLNVYGNSNLNSDIIIKSDEWENNMITISGSVSEHTAKVQGYADLILDSYEYRDENSHIVYYYPALKFFYRYRKYNGSTYASFTKKFRIEAGQFYISDNIAYTGLIIGSTEYGNLSLTIFTDDVFLRHSLTITDNLNAYGDTILGDNDGNNTLTVNATSTFNNNIILNSNYTYGSTLPLTGQEGQIFFKLL